MIDQIILIMILIGVMLILGIEAGWIWYLQSMGDMM